MSTATEVKTVYEGIEISYNEGEDKWTFELRGRDRSAASLARAKEAIDAPLPVEKVPFVRFPAYRQQYGSDYEVVTVTSIAEKGYRGEAEFWISDARKNRCKVRASSLYAHSPENTAIIGHVSEVQKQSAALDAKELELKRSLAPIETKDWE